jgi:MoaA/NifB/PqqE/SkfB family radical SAM enzyme
MDVEKIFSLNDEEFLKAIYRELLGREADADGLAHFLSILREKRNSKRFVVRVIKNSQEYRTRRAKSALPRRVIQNKNLNEEELRAGKTILASKPLSFNLDLIGRCNMNPPCSMCTYRRDTAGPRFHPGLTADDLRAFGEPIQLAWDVINCSIGEPLILKDLIPILELLAAWEKPIGLNSNGLALTPELTEKLVPFFEILTIVFSVDAATPETYAKIRGDHFLKVIENIAHYCRRRREVIPEGAASKTGLVMLPMRANRHEVSALIRLAAWLGVDVFELRSLNEIEGDWKVTRDDFVFDYREQMLSNEELQEVFLEAEKTASECGLILDCQYQVSENKTHETFLPEDKWPGKIKCTQPWHFILPYQNGDTVGCCYMGKSLGNWRVEGLEALWNGERMKRLRGEMAEGKLPEECRNYISCPVVRANIRPSPGQKKWGRSYFFKPKSFLSSLRSNQRKK